MTSSSTHAGTRTILYVSTQTEMGGAQHSFLDMIRTLDSSRFRALVVVNNRGELFQRLQQLNVETAVIPFVTPLPFLKLLNPLLWLVNAAALVRLSRLAADRSMSLIHCNDGAGLYFAVLAKILHGIPVVFHVRWFETGLRKALVFFAARYWVDKIVTNSAAVKHYVEQGLSRTPRGITVVYNAIDINLFHPSLPNSLLRDELKIPPDRTIIGMVGRFVGWKNHAMFIQIARLLVERGNHSEFCLIGAAQFKNYTTDTEALRRSLIDLIKKEGLESRVHLLGYRGDIAQTMGGLDLLVCPSENEPFGRVVIEAMACGVPVVASDSGGIPEIITHGESGLLVPTNEPSTFADAVDRLLCDRTLYDHIRAQGRAAVESRFSLNQLQQALQQVYDEMLTK